MVPYQGLWHGAPDQRRRERSERRPTAWIRVSIDVVDHPDVAELTDSAFRCLVTVWCRAKRQPEPGVFRSEEHMRRAVGSRLARCLPALYASRLLERESDTLDEGARSDRVRVHNWSRWQTDGRADGTHAERQKRYRKREKAKRDASRDAVTRDQGVTTSDGGPPTPVGSATVTPPASPADVTLPRDMGARRDLARAIREAKGDGFVQRYNRAFDRQYGQLYPRPRRSDPRRLHAALRSIVRVDSAHVAFDERKAP